MHVQKLILLVLLISPGVSGAAEVYKSVDEDGNVVFTDEPPDGVDSEPVHLEPYGPPSTPSVVGRVRQNSFVQDGTETVDSEKLERLVEQHAANHIRWCTEARVALETLHQGMPVYRIGDGQYRAAWTGDQYKGPRQYLDDSQREEAIDAELRKLAMNCKDPFNADEQEDAATNWLYSEHCAAVRVDLEHLLHPGSRAADQSIADARRMVDQYCKN